MRERTRRRLVVLTMLAVLAVVLGPVGDLYGATGPGVRIVDNIYFKIRDTIQGAETSPYGPLLRLKKGDPFSQRMVRRSMENLYKAENFENIEVKVRHKDEGKLDIYIIVQHRYRIASLRLIRRTGATTRDDVPFRDFKKKELKTAIFALREGEYYDPARLEQAVKDATAFLEGRGYFGARVTHEVKTNHRRRSVGIKFFVFTGPRTTIGTMDVQVVPAELKEELLPHLQFTGKRDYVPFRFDRDLARLDKALKQLHFYYPRVDVHREFRSPQRRRINIKITIKPGYRYVFKFEGVGDRTKLIASVWMKKVFEKWAEKESNARVLYDLKNKGYLDAEVRSSIEINDSKGAGEKIITFRVKKKNRYRLGKIHFQGNKYVPEKDLREVIKTDDLFFDRFFYLRLSSLLVDQEILKLLFYFRGFPSAGVYIEPRFREGGRTGRADVHFMVDEGPRFTVETILFDGNRYFTDQRLRPVMKTREKGPFAQQRLQEDIEALKRLYHSHGFDRADVTPEISPGRKKTLLIRVNEGEPYQMGKLIIIGASKSQRKLLGKLFPLRPGDSFDRAKIEHFRGDIGTSSIFNRFKIVEIENAPNVLDVLIKATPDHSRYYGFGIGWEGRRWFRGTLEYQQRNVFGSYSTFSALAQVGPHEQRGVLSYDTPFFLKTHMDSSLKLWADNEIYPSYKFNRYGIGETVVKKLTPESYIVGTLSLYRTVLTDLRFSPQGLDLLDTPFDTTALNLSYVKDRRDDPFNPSRGYFFSSDLKVGFPLLEKHYSFIKFRWSFQENFKIFKIGTFAASVRNGFASGEMSVTERFFAGGITTFRGTRRDRLSPIDPWTNEPMGGNSLILFNFEATFPLLVLPLSDIYYALFADFGNVFATARDFHLGRLEKAVGVSLKYKTPMGPLRFDVAWNLRTGEPRFHIGIGNVF